MVNSILYERKIGFNSHVIITEISPKLADDQRRIIMNNKKVNQSDEKLNDIYANADKIKTFELGEEANKPTIGLALSGGGIRSASFAMGVVQAFVREGINNKDPDTNRKDKNIKPFDQQFQYLSTVSGGGYFGSTLTWLKSLGKDLNEQLDTKTAGARNRGENSWLDYVRQHGNYLKPNVISSLGLASVFIRNIIVAFSVYFSLLIVLFYFADKIGEAGTFNFTSFTIFTYKIDEISIPLLFLTSVCLYLLIIILYSCMTYIGSFSQRKNVKFENYKFRLNIQKYLGNILVVVITTGILSLIPYIYDYLYSGNVGVFTVSSVAGGAGITGAIFQFFKGRAASVIRGFSANVRIILTATLLIFGLLLGSYAIVHQYESLLEGCIVYIVIGLIAVSLFTNLNYFGITRMYRDRLMETFMPDSKAILSGNWQPAYEADITPLSDFADVRPFHIVNANIVLVDSDKDMCRGRGGDSFIMSPKSCGSDATGYVKTKDWQNNRMNLPTAVAISGAALNPNTGVSGRGIGKNRLVSFLLAFLQIRLGYWATNPKVCIDDKRRFLAKIFKPNYLFPGIRQGLLGRGLDDNAVWSELTDGGHFDNTGVYELIKRKVDVIVLSMAGADPEYKFADLANLIQKVRVDFGTIIQFKDNELDSLIPNDTENQAKGFAIAEICYNDTSRGTLIIIATTAVATMPADLFSYKKENPLFPHESTSDQFYDEQQLEAYRELGFHIASNCIKTESIKKMLNN